MLFIARTPAAALGIYNPSLLSSFGGSLLTQEGTKNKSQAQLGCDWKFEDARTPAAAQGIYNPSLSAKDQKSIRISSLRT